MYDPEQITFFAKTDARGQQVPFGIKANDRTRHVYVIGKTGMGKSTLLENMAVQDIKNGNGLAFIDPHGQTAETLLDYIPEERKDDVVYFAPFDTDNPVSFNVMEDVGEDKRHLVVSGLMSVFKKIWVDAWSARMEYILSNTLLALLEYPDSTLLGVNRMLSDKEYRMRVIENITDPAVKSFWVDEFLKYNERYMQEAGDAIKNKIGQFTSNPLIRNIIGQPHSSFDIRKIMDDRKIMIMNLSKGLVGEQNANLLGSMLTTRIYLAAMSRADKTPEEMKAAPNFYFYVDEFQSFANATFADILSEARKYKLNLTIAHQYVEQMEEEVRNAVFGNVGTIISFRVGPFDAEILETVFTPKFLAPDIVNLGFAQIYLTLMIDGIGSAPFSAITLPPIENPGASYRDAVIAASRKQFSQKRAGVEEAIHAWHEKNFSNKPPYVPKHLREKADGGDLPNTGENKKKYGVDGVAPKDQQNTSTPAASAPKEQIQGNTNGKPAHKSTSAGRPAQHRTANNDTSKTVGSRPNNDKTGAREGGHHKNNGGKQTKTHEPRKEKSADELRSVLKNLAAEEKNKTNVKKGAKNEKARDENGNLVKDESALKSALAAALGAAAGTSSTQSSPKEPEKESEVQSQEPAPKPASPTQKKLPQTAPKKASEKAPRAKDARAEKEDRPQQGARDMVRAAVAPQKEAVPTNAPQHSEKKPSQTNTTVQTKAVPEKVPAHSQQQNSRTQQKVAETQQKPAQIQQQSIQQQQQVQTQQPAQMQKKDNAVSDAQDTLSSTADAQAQRVPAPQQKAMPDTATQTAKQQKETTNEYALLKNRQSADPLSPKKLERMMRVTTSDKTPLR